MNYIRITKENIDREHICCAMSNKQSNTKKEWLKERFEEGKSIRKYAEAHNLNRGSVMYIQNKLMATLSKLLEERDRADGKSRLAK